MKQYLDSLRFIIENGDIRGDRTGTGTIGVFGQTTKYDLTLGFPATTTKKLAWKAMTSELLWMLEGSANEQRLREILHGREGMHKSTIWTANYEKQAVDLGYKNGYMGPIYGRQWRSWDGTDIQGDEVVVDQICNVIHSLKTDPFSRRHIVSAWNAAQLEDMALPPCHLLFQFYVDSTDHLHCQMYQRSADMFLGVPFNVASYSLLTHIIAHICGYGVGTFTHVIGDAHIYINHLDAVKTQLTREPEELPKLWLSPSIRHISDLTMDSFKLVGYNPMPSIKAEMSV